MARFGETGRRHQTALKHHDQRKKLCRVCNDAMKRISRKIVQWPHVPPFTHPRIDDIWDPCYRKGRLLPVNVVKHVSRARLLPESAKKCPFCALIRDALIVAYYHQKANRQLLDLPVARFL